VLARRLPREHRVHFGPPPATAASSAAIPSGKAPAALFVQHVLAWRVFGEAGLDRRGAPWAVGGVPESANVCGSPARRNAGPSAAASNPIATTREHHVECNRACRPTLHHWHSEPLYVLPRVSSLRTRPCEIMPAWA